MKLYHGSNVSIDEIDLKRGRKGKDFGQGFYLSKERVQAQMMAERTVDREEAGEATLTIYEFDEHFTLAESEFLHLWGILFKHTTFYGIKMRLARFLVGNGE